MSGSLATGLEDLAFLQEISMAPPPVEIETKNYLQL